MTTTEPTLAALDDQLGRLDDALTRLTAQRDGVELEAKTLGEQWRERAAWGDVDGDLTTRRKGFEASLSSVDEAIELNRAKYAEVAAQRGALVAEQQLVVDRERYTADVATFAQRVDAATLIDRLLEVAYGAVRATVAELDELNREQQRLDGEAGRLGMSVPPRRMDVAWAPDVLGRAPTELVRAVLHMDGWPREKRAAEVLTEYLRTRVFATSRENANEPAPTWAQVVGRVGS